MWRAVKILLDGRISGAPVIDDEYNVMGFSPSADCVLFLVNARYYEVLPARSRSTCPRA